MIKKNRFRYFEIGIYLLIAIIAIIFPLFIQFENGREWRFILREWIKLVPFLLIFLVNNFFLAPRLLFKAKYPSYILSCIGLLLIVAALNNVFIKPHFPPHFYNQKKEIAFNKEGAKQEFFELRKGLERFPHENRPKPPKKIFFSFNVLFIGFLIIGFNSGIKIFVRWMEDEEDRNEKERHYLSTELAFLKHQVSPHFFMNTLNNIHALVDIDSEQAKDSILKLSKLMRYLLYESDVENVPLDKEIEFLESYIELMRLRYDETNLTIAIDYTESDKQIKVPSLLFLPLIENAFKHGVRINAKSFVSIQFVTKNNYLTLIVRNKNLPKTQAEFDEASGIGLENIRKRLELIYKDDYSLDIKVDDEVFEVILTILIQ